MVISTCTCFVCVNAAHVKKCLEVIKNVRTVTFNNYIAIQGVCMVNKQFGLKNNNNFFSGSLLVTLPIHSSSTDV